MARRKSKSNLKEIEAYAAFDNSFNLIYGSVKPNKTDAQAVMHRFNPPVDGVAYHCRIFPIRITIDLNKQHDLFDKG